MKRYNIIVTMLTVLLLAGGCSAKSYPTVSLKAVKPLEQQKKDEKKPLRVALSSITSPRQSRVYYEDLLNYLGEATGKPVQIIQRKSYAEVNDLLRAGSVDLAFVCTYSYVAGRYEFGLDLIAAPLIRGKNTYQSYIITGSDSGIKSFDEFKGKRFAFTDPMSTTGTLYPVFLLVEMGQLPETYFSSYFYTYSHDNSIEAVAQGVVDGATVDSTVFDNLVEQMPDYAKKLKVIGRSPEYAMPPVVVRSNLGPEVKTRIQQVLLDMHETNKGREILQQLRIDRFVLVDDGSYNSVRKLARAVKSNVIPSN